MAFTPVTLALTLAIFSLVVVALSAPLRPGAAAQSAALFSGFLLSIALSLGNFFYMYSGLVAQAPAFAFLGNTLGVAAAPFLYLYARTMAFPDARIAPWSCLHFLPVLGFLSLVAAAYTIQPEDVKLAILREPSYRSLVNAPALPAAIFAFVFVYLGLTLRLLYRHRRRFREQYAAANRAELGWLRVSVVGALLLWATSLLHQIVIAVSPVAILDRPFLAVLASGALMVALFFLAHALRAPTGAPTAVTPAPEKYGVHRLSDDEARTFGGLLEAHLAATKAHLDPDATLDGIAATLPMTSRELSQTINRHYGKSFFDFINDLRAEEAKTRLVREPTATVTAVMTACGFSSKSSFYTAFRRATGLTPTQYRARHRSIGVQEG